MGVGRRGNMAMGWEGAGARQQHRLPHLLVSVSPFHGCESRPRAGMGFPHLAEGLARAGVAVAGGDVQRRRAVGPRSIRLPRLFAAPLADSHCMS
jgi:hypothetical protein